MTAAMQNVLPPSTEWTAFGIGRGAFPILVQAFIFHGISASGWEDTVHVAKGRLASGNAELVAKARHLVDEFVGELASTEETRQRLGIDQ